MSIKKNDFKISTIIPMYNVEKFISETIESVINQTLNFVENIQLILVDDGSSDNSKNIALDYQKIFPNNIKVISKENEGVATARNLGLEYATGEIVNFLDSDDLISNNTYEEVYKFYSKNKSEDYDVVAIPINFFESWTGEHPLNYKFEECKLDIVDLNIYDYFISNITVFIRRNAIKDLRFETKLSHMEDALFINQIILNKMKFGLVRNGTYLYRKRFSKSSLTNNSTLKKEYYTDRFKYGYMKLINNSLDKLGYVPKFLQNYFIYDLGWLLKIENFNEHIHSVLNENEIEEFYDYFDKILSYLEISSILNHATIPSYIKHFLIYLKNKDFHIDTTRKKVFIRSNDIILNRLHTRNLWLDIIDLKDGFLNISGCLGSYCDNNFIRIEAIKNINGKKTTYKSKFYHYSETARETQECLSIPWLFYYNFDFKIPIHQNEISNISFQIIYEENNITVPINAKIKFYGHANLNEYSPYSIRDNQIILLRNNRIYIEEYEFIKLVKNEIKSLITLFKKHPRYFIRSVFFRVLFVIFYPIMRKRNIWMFMDRKMSSGDNGEHLFTYSLTKQDNIEKYFVISKKSNQYKSLKNKYKNQIISFGSIKHKFLYLFTQKFISSHCDLAFINPFYEHNYRLYAGYVRFKLYFLQHGVPKYKMPNWLKKYDHNLSLLTAVSDIDYNSYVNDYNYDKDIIQILGYPRFDHLTNENKKKQIVILFSWRQYITNEEILLESEYFEKLNSLINNEKLIKNCKEKGYDIILKMHPRLSEYIKLFDKNDYINFDETSKIHDLICDSALMITDYSSVAFDFAYLKKPIIYYHYGEDYHFNIDDAIFNEKEFGFGEIINEENDLVDKIIYYIENNCIMEDKYKNNINNFFKYIDEHNSERCYEWIRNH